MYVIWIKRGIEDRIGLRDAWIIIRSILRPTHRPGFTALDFGAWSINTVERIETWPEIMNVRALSEERKRGKRFPLAVRMPLCVRAHTNNTDISCTLASRHVSSAKRGTGQRRYKKESRWREERKRGERWRCWRRHGSCNNRKVSCSGQRQASEHHLATALTYVTGSHNNFTRPRGTRHDVQCMFPGRSSFPFAREKRTVTMTGHHYMLAGQIRKRRAGDYLRDRFLFLRSRVKPLRMSLNVARRYEDCIFLRDHSSPGYILRNLLC